MVGIFSRFSGSKGGLRRAQSDGVDNIGSLPSNPEGKGTHSAATNTPHGIELAVEFKPVEHPTEPLDNDQPIQCPVPEPSILNDGRIWKESQSIRRRADLPVMKEGEETPVSDSCGTKPRPTQSNRMMLPSASAPECNILNLLEECNAPAPIAEIH